SIMVNVGEELQRRIPNAVIDGEVGRQVGDTLELVEDNYDEYGGTDDIIVIQLGTNGTFTEEELNALISVFEEAEIYFVNTRVPRPWETSVNEIWKKRRTIIIMSRLLTGIHIPKVKLSIFQQTEYTFYRKGLKVWLIL